MTTEPPAAPRGVAFVRRRLLPADPRKRRLVLVAAPAAAALLLGVLLGVGFAAVIHVPRVEAVADFSPGLITELYDREGRVFATYARERRRPLEEGEVPDLVRNAVLAAEDANFLQHGGVDAEGVLRAVIQNLRRGRRSMGGSTITMQLARKIFLSPRKAWRRKIEEAFLAVQLEKTFSKQQILTLYCNLMYFGHGNYGVESAARDFFGKPVDELELAEAATLAGILQRPSAYSPYRRPDLVIGRRNYVLRQMLDEGFIDREAFDSAIESPLEVVRAQKTQLEAPYLAEEVRQHLESQYGTDAVLDQGLQAHTTLDPAIQRAAERALRDGLVQLDRGKGWRGEPARVEPSEIADTWLPDWDRVDLSPGRWVRGLVTAAGPSEATVRIGDRRFVLDREGIAWTRQSRPDRLLEPGDVAWFRIEPPDEETEPESEEETVGRLALEQEPELEGAVLVIESATGAVRAMVGGWSFQRSKFNRAVQAKRQVGSAFKPFVYGAAFEIGFTPADTLFDAPIAFPAVAEQPPYSPRNHRRNYFGILTLRRAVELSINVTSVKLLDLVGADRVVEFARRAGIRSDLPPYPSLALGSADLTPLELASAYATIANQGVYVEPYLIDSVQLPSGRVLEEHRPTAHRAMEPEIAYVLTHVLEGVIDRGSGRLASDLDLDLAGKTGTTDDYSDAWFVGFTPRYTVLAWVGYDIKRTIGRDMTGTRAALPIWKSVLTQGLEAGWLAEGGRFVPPPRVVLVDVEPMSGLLPGPGAARVIEEAFVDGTQPVLQYSAQWGRILGLPWYQQRRHYLPKAGERMPEEVADWEPVLEAWADD